MMVRRIACGVGLLALGVTFLAVMVAATYGSTVALFCLIVFVAALVIAVVLFYDGNPHRISEGTVVGRRHESGTELRELQLEDPRGKKGWIRCSGQAFEDYPDGSTYPKK